MTSPSNQSKIPILILISILSFVIRYSVIQLTPEGDNFIDLCIYRNTGELLQAGINPYNFQDGVEQRNAFRLDERAYEPATCLTQERWDTYASSNLPLTLLLHGWIEAISPEASFYRIVFVFFDSLIPIFLGLYLFSSWRGISHGKTIWIVLCLSAISPVFIRWGAILPEDKGVQILLMICALYFSSANNRFIRIFLGSFFLAASIDFKLFGVFLAPVCIYSIFFKSPQEAMKQRIRDVGTYLLLTAFFVIIWFVPFSPHVWPVIYDRFVKNSVALLPSHASIWRIFHLFFPDGWALIRHVTVILCLGFTFIKFFRRSTTLEILMADLLLIYSNVFLLTGSLDRMHMGIVIAIVLFGLKHTQKALVLVNYYFYAGAALILYRFFVVFIPSNLPDILKEWEFMDSIYTLGFAIIYFCLSYSLKKNTTPSLERANSHSS